MINYDWQVLGSHVGGLGALGGIGGIGGLVSSAAAGGSVSSTAVGGAGYSLHQLQGNKQHGLSRTGFLLKKSEGKMRKVCFIQDSGILDFKLIGVRFDCRCGRSASAKCGTGSCRCTTATRPSRRLESTCSPVRSNLSPRTRDASTSSPVTIAIPLT